MKTLSIFILSFFLTSFTVSLEVVAPQDLNEPTVIICTGKYAKRYHNSMCRGMNACKGEAKRIKLSEAEAIGLTPCGYCYR